MTHICPKVNTKSSLEFELVYYNVTVQHICYYVTKIPPIRSWYQTNHHHHYQLALIAQISLTLSLSLSRPIFPYHLFLPAGLQNYSTHIINFVYEICLRFSLLCGKLESVGYSLWRKQHHNAIHSSRNLEMVCCTAWYSRSKLLYNDFRMFRCQSKDRFILVLMKTKYPVLIVVWGDL